MRKVIFLLILLALFSGSVASAALVDNGNGTVTDIGSGLMWQKATAPGTYTWQQALSYCENLSLAGHTDWRLPNVDELWSLVDYSHHSPAIDPLLAPYTASDFYWSSTSDTIPPPDPDAAWFVDFDVGWRYVMYKLISTYVRAVRGGPVCTYSILPTSATGSASGGSGSIAVTASAGTCAWTAVSNAAWITVTSGSSGTGNGTVGYSYTANYTGSPRTGTITIAGNNFNVTQASLVPIIQVTPSILTFGYVPPGSYKDLTLEVKNIGTGTLVGTVSATPPFSIVSGGSYSLGVNQSQQVVVRYTAPLQGGSQTGSLTFTGGGGFTVQVKGTNKMVGLPWLMLLLGN